MKLELEAVLKLEKWDELDDLFEQCWRYKSPDHYETLADLVLVIHSCVMKAELGVKYQSSKCMKDGISDTILTNPVEVLSVLQKIISLTCRQPGSDITKLSRWLRCLFNLALVYDENISLKCVDQVTYMAAKKQAVSFLSTVE